RWWRPAGEAVHPAPPRKHGGPRRSSRLTRTARPSSRWRSTGLSFWCYSSSSLSSPSPTTPRSPCTAASSCGASRTSSGRCWSATSPCTGSRSSTTGPAGRRDGNQPGSYRVEFTLARLICRAGRIRMVATLHIAQAPHLPPAARPARGPLPMTWRRVLAGVLALALVPFARSQVPPDQQADMVLTSARKAHNEGNYPFAIQRYGEFLQKFGGHPQANAARYQLALAYLESPDRNYDKAIEQLNPLVGNAGLPEHPYALYHAGLCLRGLGLRELDGAAAKPNEAVAFKQRADQRFTEAASRFAGAVAAFPPKLPQGTPEKPATELDWAARSRCDQVEIELRLGKFKEAKAAAEPVAKEAQFSKSRYHKLGLYYHGFAAFQTQDYLVAGRSLSLLAPFDDPHTGLHARYLLGRVYQVTEQKAEAAQAFEAVLAGYEQQKKEAAEALKRPEQFAKNPAEKARLEALVRNPPPDHVAASVFFAACLGYEAGEVGESLAEFQEVAKAYPQAPPVPEATLRGGVCPVQR